MIYCALGCDTTLWHCD